MRSNTGAERNERTGLLFDPLPSTSIPLSLYFPTFLASLPLISFPIEVGPLNPTMEVWGSAVSSPSGVWGGAGAEIEFGAF